MTISFYVWETGWEPHLEGTSMLDDLKGVQLLALVIGKRELPLCKYLILTCLGCNPYVFP